MGRSHCMNILHYLHFTDNRIAEKSDKVYKMRIAINHLNKVLSMLQQNRIPV